MVNRAAVLGKASPPAKTQNAAHPTDVTNDFALFSFHLPPSGVDAVAEYTKFQQKVIKNYYDNLDTVQLQRLGEQVTEIYLAEGKARAKRWKDIAKLL